MQTYAQDFATWRAYQAHFPPALRLGVASLPREERWDWRGLSVHLDRYESAQAPLTVILCHGAGGYGRMLAPYGRLLNEQGIAVVLPDLPGYGLTAIEGRRMRYALWVELIVALAQAERARNGRPVVLMGASIGGMLVLHAAMAAPAAAIAGVIATTLIDPRDPLVRRSVARLPGARHLVGAMRAFSALRLPMPWLAKMHAMSSVPAINALCARDPQGGGNRVPLGFLHSWMTYQPALAFEDFDRCPVLLAHPAADRWTPAALSRSVLERLKAPTRYVELPRCEHLPIEEPGLTVLLEAVGAFLRERVAVSLPA